MVEVVDWVGGPIVASEFRQLKLRWNWGRRDFFCERSAPRPDGGLVMGSGRLNSGSFLMMGRISDGGLPNRGRSLTRRYSSGRRSDTRRFSESRRLSLCVSSLLGLFSPASELALPLSSGCFSRPAAPRVVLPSWVEWRLADVDRSRFRREAVGKVGLGRIPYGCHRRDGKDIVGLVYSWRGSPDHRRRCAGMTCRHRRRRTLSIGRLCIILITFDLLYLTNRALPLYRMRLLVLLHPH
ncbi:hypothetical protein Taro_015196 [Colocasia esculenta]|uniref:Uncharacterized protein n=1 Tax=Colocasia esculenta TaxID=4460 RepID=A0A843UGP5_COLES|nr:hypothetical protein [Colocasia esculenta]